MFSSLCFSARLRPRSCAELLLPAVQSLQRPARMTPHQIGAIRTRESVQQPYEFAGPAVASRDTRIPYQPVPLDAPYRRPEEARVEAVVVQRQQVAWSFLGMMYAP